jgi:hypothetical protein
MRGAFDLEGSGRFGIKPELLKAGRAGRVAGHIVEPNDGHASGDPKDGSGR